MSQSVIISSEKFDGEICNVLFKPSNNNVVINLGDVILPLTFEPFLLTPPQEIYGDYTINVLENNCVYYLNIPNPTPTPTPTPTVTPTPTPTVTPTVTPTTSYDPCSIPTQTPTSSVTPTITPTQTITPTPSQSFNPCSN